MGIRCNRHISVAVSRGIRPSERKKRRLTIEKAKATSESRVQSPDAAGSCAPKPDPDAAVATRASSTIEPDCRIFGVRKPGREQVVLRVRRRGDI